MKEYLIYVYGYGGLNPFRTHAESEDLALDNVVIELIENNETNYFYEVDAITEDEAEDMGLIYIDATMSGADRPVYIDGLNLKIFEI
ncbi:MAG: hypothetical protein IKA83_08830 [Paludibacteraceae bacterium]|nr:hypothetical protein [Paludibacteraceae bacterium]MBR6686821.1 hypothetical protein [Paludibacteraceae bacterium]